MSYPQPHTPEEKLADAKKLLSLPPIVVICGSTRFMTEMTEADLRETEAGKIVVKPGIDMKSPHDLWSDPVEAESLKVRLDDLHRAKIRLADEVLVVGDYIGVSTRAEIAYARSLGKPVRFTHSEADPDVKARRETLRCGWASCLAKRRTSSITGSKPVAGRSSNACRFLSGFRQRRRRATETEMGTTIGTGSSHQVLPVSQVGFWMGVRRACRWLRPAGLSFSPGHVVDRSARAECGSWGVLSTPLGGYGCSQQAGHGGRERSWRCSKARRLSSPVARGGSAGLSCCGLRGTGRLCSSTTRRTSTLRMRSCGRPRKRAGRSLRSSWIWRSLARPRSC